MNKSVEVRDYTPADYQQILNLWETVGLSGAHRGDNQHVIEQSIAMGGKLLVATLSTGQLIATSWITFDGRRLHLHHLGVDPHFQRAGVGEMITKESLGFAKLKGYQIKLEVHQNNLAAINLYKKLGFNYLGDYDVYIVRNFDELKL